MNLITFIDATKNDNSYKNQLDIHLPEHFTFGEKTTFYYNKRPYYIKTISMLTPHNIVKDKIGISMTIYVIPL